MRAQFLGDIYAFEELSCRQFGENVRESLGKLSNAMSLRTCSLDFTQLDMGTNGNLRYAVYLIPSFSSAPKDINVLFRLKICFLKKIYCGKLCHIDRNLQSSKSMNRSMSTDHLLLCDSTPSKTGSKIEIKDAFCSWKS